MILILSALLSLKLFATSEIKCVANYDEMQITHQEVKSEQDFYYCFGYHHGRDRAWEMDYFRRVGLGTNAEIYGFSHLKSDLMMRLLDLPAMAEKLWVSMPSDKKMLLEQYARGVNLGFEEGKNSKEFLDLNYTPDKWIPQHSLLVLVLQSFDQTRKTFFRDYEEEKSKEKWKDQAANLFDEDNMPWDNTILKEGEYSKRKALVMTTSTSSQKFKLWAPFPSVFGEESGSNNWVVSAKKSKSGYAILANDPHLDLKTPLFWYWIHLKSKDVNVVGGSIPGVPVVISGTNGKVAWGLTNAYLNTADVVFVQDPPKDFTVSIRPTVKVKFGFMKLPFFFKSFEKTQEGLPIVPLELENETKMVLKWTGFSLTIQDILPMFDLVHTSSVAEMDSLLLKVGLPAWNFVFADSKGDIGYRVVGKAYLHDSKIPFGISTVPFASLKDEKFLDPKDRPSVLKPKRNYVYTANNRHWPIDAKFYGGRGYSYSFRGFRIDELLVGKQDLQTTQSIQCDRQVVDARFFVERILKNIDVPELKNWDFIAHEESLATSVYRRLMDLMMEQWGLNEYALYKFLNLLPSEKRAELQIIYKQALKEIKGRKWGEFHRLGFAHLSKNTDWNFSPEIAGIGDNHSVNPGTAKWNEDRNVYEQNGGASMRMIIEMKKTPEIHLALPGINRSYTNDSQNSAWNEWHHCQYKKVAF